MEKPAETTRGEVCGLPNGYTLYRKSNGVGGHCYYSDEIGGDCRGRKANLH
jgi:hypothetical protein